MSNTENSELQLSHIKCESTDDESETESTLSLNMLQIENEYETPIERNFYQNNHNNFENSDNTQNKTNYTEQELKGRSGTNNIYQNTANTTNKVQLPKEKIWTIPLLLESPRSKDFQSPDLEIDFLVDSGAESNIINIPTWNEIQTLHPKFSPSKTSNKLATSQGLGFTNFGKSLLLLVPTRTMEQNKFLTNHFK